MSLLEKELIGAVLNSPDAVDTALGVLPTYFSDPVYSAAWEAIRSANGQFTIATVLADVAHIPGAGDKIFDAYDTVSSDFGMTGATAARLIEDYKARQGRLISDWIHNALMAGNKYDQVLAEFRPHYEALAGIGNTKSRFSGLPASKIDIPVTQWIIKRMMPVEGVGFIAGASGAGKSFLTLHAALCLSTGAGGVFKRRCNKVGVVYIAAEDYIGCQSRVKAWQIRHPNSDEAVFELFDGPVDLLDANCVMDLIRGINEAAKRFAMMGERLGLVVFDTLARCIPGADENSAQFMSQAVQALELVGRMTGTFVTAVAHHGKSGATGGIRGWSGMNAASDMTITVERREDDPNVREMTFSKIKNGIDGQKISFRLDRVGLGIYDEDGEELDSAVCQFENIEDAKDRVQQRSLTAPQRIVLDAVKWVVDNGENQPMPIGANARVWSRAVAFKDVLDRASKNGFWGEGVVLHKRFCGVLEVLIAQKRVGMDTAEDSMWLL